MTSTEIWQQIEQHLAEISHLLTTYEEAIITENEALSQCDKFDQDALHLLEFTAMNAGESAKLMKEWRHSRVLRRSLKERIQHSQQILPFLRRLDAQLLTKPVPAAPKNAYAIRSAKMNDFAQSLYDKGRLQPNLFQQLACDQPATPSTTNIFQTTNAEATDYHLEKIDGRWHIFKQNDLLFEHKKLPTIIDYVIQRDICLYTPPPYDVTIKGLITSALRE